MCPELDEHCMVSGPFLHELTGAHVFVQTFSTFVMAGCQTVMLFTQLLSCLLLVSLMASHWLFTWRASVLQYDSWALLWTVGILYFITPFTICLPIVWKTHIYPAVWADCNMFREYSNTPYLPGFVGLLVLFQLIFPFKMVWLFPTILRLVWKCFLIRERESLTIENNVGHFDSANKLRLFWYTLTKHIEDVLCYFDDRAYVSVLVFIFSALTI